MLQVDVSTGVNLQHFNFFIAWQEWRKCGSTKQSAWTTVDQYVNLKITNIGALLYYNLLTCNLTYLILILNYFSEIISSVLKIVRSVHH